MYAKAVIILFSIIGALMGATKTIDTYTSASYSYATEDTAEVNVRKTNEGVVIRRNDGTGTTLFLRLRNEPNEP